MLRVHGDRTICGFTTCRRWSIIYMPCRLQEGMEMDAQGRGLCISFSWLVNDRTLVGTPSSHCAG